MKYLVVETYTVDGKEFMHFIELTKVSVEKDVISFAKDIVRRNEVIRKVYFSNSELTNW